MTRTSLVPRLMELLGPESVSSDPSELDRCAQDAWPVSVVRAKLGRLPFRPEVVIRPRSVADIQKVLRLAAETGTPVTSRGLGSSVTGQPLPVDGGIVLDLSSLTSEPTLSPVDRYVTVAAGVCGGDLESWLSQRGLTLNHSPQSLGRSTVGGWVATRATGQFSSKFGGIEDLVVGYEVVLADGSLVEVSQRPRAAMGPDLRSVFIGSEGTLGVITRVSLKVFAVPESRIYEGISLPSLDVALDLMRHIVQCGLRPHLLRLYDADEAAAFGQGVQAAPLLLIGTEGTERTARAEYQEIVEAARERGGVLLGAEPVESWLDHRFDFSTVENLLAEPGGYAETIEVANFWSRLEPMYHELKAQLGPLADQVLGHFSHTYAQGSSLYLVLLGRVADDELALKRLQDIWATAMGITLAHHGELSHHHGAGLARSPYVRESLGSGFEVLARMKAALDPAGILNPGKLQLGNLGNGD